MTPKISIIVPIYNSFVRLQTCINSIILQDEDNFECILIDDGSTDDSPSLCDKYAQSDTRFKVIHKKNGGVSSARNAGLDCAKGAWIVFVDSDDSIRKNHLSSLLTTAEQYSQADWILCGYDDILPDKYKRHSYQKQSWLGMQELSDLFSNSDVLDYMIPWDKMFRNSIIQEHHLRFDENLSISEDRLFCYHYMLYVSGIAATGQATYIHDATDQNSLSYRAHSFQMLSYRHKCLSEASRTLLMHFAFKGNEAISFIRYDWGYFKSAVHAAASESNNIIKGIRKQRQFYLDYFDRSFYAHAGIIPLSLLRTKEDKLIFRGQFLILYLYYVLRRS